MSRFIDADKLEQFLHRDEWGTPDECWRPEHEFGKFIDVLSTADVRENVKGEWIREPNCYYRCSVCGEHYPSFRDDMDYNFCPNCGADMRGEKDV